MKKNRLIAAVISMCIASALASCASNDKSNVTITTNTDSSAQSTDASVKNEKDEKDEINESEALVIGGTDANGYTVTGIPVTDTKGEKVTDSSGVEVTEIAVVDNKGNIVTDPQGNNAKPQISSNSSSESELLEGLEELKDSTPSSASGTNSVLWITNLTHSVTVVSNGVNKTINQIKEVDGNGDLFTVTIKIADNAPDGNYAVRFGRPASSSKGSFCGESQSNYSINYYDGNITVGSAEAPEKASVEGMACSLDNVSASAGSEVVMTCRLSGVNGLAAFNTYLTYDSTYISVTAINAGNTIAGKGDFMCQ